MLLQLDMLKSATVCLENYFSASSMLFQMDRTYDICWAAIETMILICLLCAIFCLPNFETQACYFLSTPKPRIWAHDFPEGSLILIDESVALYVVDHQPEPWLGSRQVFALLPLKVSIFKLLLCTGSRQTANKQ